MANNDLRGRRIVDSKPVVRAPLDEYGFPHGAGNNLPPYFYNFPQALRNAEGIMCLTSITCFVTLHNRKDTSPEGPFTHNVSLLRHQGRKSSHQITLCHQAWSRNTTLLDVVMSTVIVTLQLVLM